jgi:hypothetical protein
MKTERFQAAEFRPNQMFRQPLLALVGHKAQSSVGCLLKQFKNSETFMLKTKTISEKLIMVAAIAAAICLNPGMAAAQDVVSLQTASGNYLTAVNGGLSGSQANCGPSMFALHTNATSAGTWETFGVTWLGDNQIALMTSDGQNYVTAVNGGGMGSVTDGQAIHTNATTVGPDELFTLTFSNDYSTVVLQTADGHYVTAVGGGGCGGVNSVPIHTNATSIGSWETFTLHFQPEPNSYWFQPSIVPPSNLPASTPASYQLIVPLIGQQMNNWCWAASDQMAMQYDDPLPPIQQWAEANAAFGRTDCQQELANYNPAANMPCDQPGGGSFNPFNSFGNLAGSGSSLTWDQIRYQIWVMNHPIQFAWNWVSPGSGGHVMVLTGYLTDAQGNQWVDVNNPWSGVLGVGDPQTMTYAEWVSDTSPSSYEYGAPHTHQGDWFDYTYDGFRLLYNVATNSTVPMNPVTLAQAPNQSGTVISDRLLPFEITAGGKTTSGTIEERVVQEVGTKTLDFYYRVTNSSGSSGAVTGLTIQNFGRFVVAGGYRTDGLGTAQAQSASRNISGSTIQINLQPIAPGSSSYFILLMTNASTSSDTGTITITGGQGQTQLTTDQPVS